jgi:NADH:ubiquinone oxidoreductase subunit 5 (subunit L)/multisubunit Na+/H+ antiporter MnhA subunit
VELAYFAPVLCAGAFFANVIYSRHMGLLKSFFAAVFSLSAIFGGFLVFLNVLFDALAHLPPFGVAESRGASSTASAAAAGEHAAHLLFDQTPWFTIGKFDFWATMSVDWLSVMMLGVVTFLSSLIQFYALSYMKGDNRYWWFFSVMSLFTAAMLTLVLAYDFLLLYMAWELVGLCSFLLIGFWYHELDNAEAE